MNPYYSQFNLTLDYTPLFGGVYSYSNNGKTEKDYNIEKLDISIYVSYRAEHLHVGNIITTINIDPLNLIQNEINNLKDAPLNNHYLLLAQLKSLQEIVNKGISEVSDIIEIKRQLSDA